MYVYECHQRCSMAHVETRIYFSLWVIIVLGNGTYEQTKSNTKAKLVREARVSLSYRFSQFKQFMFPELPIMKQCFNLLAKLMVWDINRSWMSSLRYSRMQILVHLTTRPRYQTSLRRKIVLGHLKCS